MTKRQWVMVIAIVLIGGVLGAAILGFGRGTDDHDHSSEETTQRKAEQGDAAGSARTTEPPAPARGKPGQDAPPETPGLLTLTDAQQRSARIAVERPTSARIAAGITLPGEIGLNEDRTAHVVARVPGIVQSVNALLGQSVRRGQVLAVLASATVSEQRASLASAERRLELARTTWERERRLFEERISAEQDLLQAKAAFAEAEIAVNTARAKLSAMGLSPDAGAGNRIELRAPFDGVVVEKHIALGEAVREDASVYTVADLSVVWANFNAAAKDLAVVRSGAPAVVRAPALDGEAHGRVAYVGDLLGEATRTAVVRVTVPNPRGAWRPGLFVNVTVIAGERDAAVTVPTDAVQTIDGRAHVFVRSSRGFVARAVELGGADGGRSEIRRGLGSDEEVVVQGSFVLKSELEKGSADHAH